jgi:uncharacterized protein (DUF362 family)/Pyruvate/2-oxoacid:ferredoxin oxidoreductase delta subunit
MKVLLKPNLLAARKPEEVTTTHPEVVAAVARQVQAAGGIVTVADSPGGPFAAAFVKKVYAASGMDEVARETGLKLNADYSDSEVANPAGKILKRLRIISAIAQADLVINLPKFKTHGQMVFTGAVKNMFGAISGTEKIEYHARMAAHDVFADAIVDICLATKPALTLMDAVVGMDGAGPAAGDPRQIGVILASADAFALDLVALSVVSVDPLGVPTVKAAVERGLCPARVGEVEVVGRSIDEVRIKRINMPAMGQMMAVTWSRGRLVDWLANRTKPRPVFDLGVCTGCGMCARHCPPKVISMDTGRPGVDLKGCIRCFCCQELCPAKAVSIWRLSPPVATVLRVMFFCVSMLASRVKSVGWRMRRKR